MAYDSPDLLICFRPACILLSSLAVCSPKTEKPLEIYFIDVEGGQATLVVSPSGQSMLVDTGWPGFNGRDADRIVAVATQRASKKSITC